MIYSFFHLAEVDLCSSKAFAQIAGVDKRYAKEWLYAMCAANYCCHDEEPQNFHLSEEQKMVFEYEDSLSLMIGAYDILFGNVHGIARVRNAFQKGKEVNYYDVHPCVFYGTARFFKPSYKSTLIQKWIPKYLGQNNLKQGVRLCDMACKKGL